MFRGRGGGGFRGRRGGGRGGGAGGGGAGGGGGKKGYNGARGGYRGNFDQGPPERVILLGSFSYPCEDDLICKVEIENVPYFNAPIYLENKEQIGKIDEIFGTVRDYAVSVKLLDNIKATSFQENQKLFIDPQKLLPIARFLPQTTRSNRKGGVPGLSGKLGGGGGGRSGGLGRGGGNSVHRGVGPNRGGRSAGGGWSKAIRGGGNGRGRW